MVERTVQANSMELWCEDFGRAANPALLLIMGSEHLAIMWPEDFCQALADAGFYVIRYYSRDTGQSTCVDLAKAPYTLSDMALDAVGLLDALGVERAHVVGLSGGGMVAQTLAIEHPARLRTLTSVSSSPPPVRAAPASRSGPCPRSPRTSHPESRRRLN